MPVLVFGTIAIDARNEDSGTDRSFNDALCPFLANLNVRRHKKFIKVKVMYQSLTT